MGAFKCCDSQHLLIHSRVAQKAGTYIYKEVFLPRWVASDPFDVPRGSIKQWPECNYSHWKQNISGSWGHSKGPLSQMSAVSTPVCQLKWAICDKMYCFDNILKLTLDSGCNTKPNVPLMSMLTVLQSKIPYWFISLHLCQSAIRLSFSGAPENVLTSFLCIKAV